MKNYGLTKYQIKKAKEKLNFNLEFMRSNGVQIDTKIIPFADFVANSYVNADRYVAELQHRAWSIYDYARARDLKNIFITLTLPSKWHKKKTYKNRLIKNRKFGGRKYICIINKIKFLNVRVKQNIPFIEPELDFSNTIDKYTPRNASKELSKMLKRLFDDRSYKKIDKDNRCYFRVTEPHKDGTPHLHISLFVPHNSVESIVKALNRLYPAPLGKIEVDVKNPVNYLMKYILKTLDDLRKEKSEITNLTLWYLYHGISRFYTSRTFVALEVYRKLNGMYNLIDLTREYNDGYLSVYINRETRKIVSIHNEHGVIYTPKPVNWYDRLIDTDHTYMDSEYEPLYKAKESKYIDIIIDGEEFVYFKGQVKKPKKMPYQMNHYELYNYFHNLDIDTVDTKHYMYTRNLMIDKGLLEGARGQLTAIDDMLEEFNNYKEIA
jgi:hypothetical protein